ncbi:Nitroreductase [Sterolibacterium denitrificans]|uniref:Nitroreductase n=1 Tax=Sterolibacterium denitrificans TaxID=157592 RepID=A0A7Z7HPS3_9PROT|nr:nitroreductase [Sterolibacterium denitrificans]SMB22575.1 Nitroreductase [Sterolibacterium denitrificans]
MTRPTTAMSVSDAVARRRSTRAFLDTPVAPELLREILTKAQRAPSGGNLQPWVVHVLAGSELQRFKALIAARRAENVFGEGPEYPIYPDHLAEPYKARRGQCAEDMYATMGIARDDKPARIEFVSGNFDFWGAPVALFVCIDRRLGATQWVDLGLYLQTFMLLCTEAGLATCAQEFWTLWHKTVAEFLRLPDTLMPFCGMAVGHADPAHPVNSLRTERAPLDEAVIFHGL